MIVRINDNNIKRNIEVNNFISMFNYDEINNEVNYRKYVGAIFNNKNRVVEVEKCASSFKVSVYSDNDMTMMLFCDTLIIDAFTNQEIILVG